jgi:hypothetical protein
MVSVDRRGRQSDRRAVQAASPADGRGGRPDTDGRAVSARTVKKKPRLSDLEPAQRVRAVRKYKALMAGKEPVPPLRCGHCRSASVRTHYDEQFKQDDPTQLHCVSCGRITSLDGARRVRQQEIAKIIIDAGFGGVA